MPPRRPHPFPALGQEALLRTPQSPSRLPTCPPRIGRSLWRRSKETRRSVRGGCRAGRESQPPRPTAGASRAASEHSWKSRARAGARGPAPPLERSGEKPGRDRAPGGPEDDPAATQTFPKGLRLRAESAREPVGAGGAVGLAERPKPGEGENLSPAPRASPLAVPAGAPRPGSRAGGRSVCASR